MAGAAADRHLGSLVIADNGEEFDGLSHLGLSVLLSVEPATPQRAAPAPIRVGRQPPLVEPAAVLTAPTPAGTAQLGALLANRQQYRSWRMRTATRAGRAASKTTSPPGPSVLCQGGHVRAVGRISLGVRLLALPAGWKVVAADVVG